MRRSRVGAALVLVLAALALCMFLCLAIMTFIRSEDRGARASADLVEVGALKETPEKLVISQIRRATRSLGSGYTWTSQPGMIRVFGTNAAGVSSTLPPRAETEEFFKLYSAARLTAPGGGNPAEDVDLLQNWDKEPERFVDLNEPVTVRPLLKQGHGPESYGSIRVYPIADPAGLPQDQHEEGRGLVEGFELRKTQPMPGKSALHPLPMPVAWLYVLRDGTIASASPGDKGKVVVTAATVDNPIVGRIAYWTDDESCKLNLNTATEPAPWEAPRTRSIGDEANATAIPAANEFYRMSGHPAYTSLAPVLNRLGRNQQPAPTEPQSATTAGGDNWWMHHRDWHPLFPHSFADLSAHTGSEGGTRAAANEVIARESRWLNTVDEFFFAPGVAGAEDRPQNTGGGTAPRLEQEELRKLRFFLTTHSRAPELNLFNRPKVSLWPISANPANRNELDQAFARASTLNGELYAFQRDEDWSSEANAGSSQKQDADMTLARNRELFNYIQDLSARAVPGFGGDFGSKYGSLSRDHLLASMFDLMRWNINPASPYNQQTIERLNPQYTYLAPGLGQPGTTNGTGAWSAAPARVQGTGETLPAALTPLGYNGPTQWAKGFGRFPVFTEIALVFAAAEVDKQGNEPKNVDAYPDFADRTNKLSAFVVVEPFVLAPGVPAVAPVYTYRIIGLDTLLVEGQPLNLPANAANRVSFSPARPLTPFNGPAGGGHSALPGLTPQFMQADGTPKTVGTNDEDVNFAFASSTPTRPLAPEKGAAGTALAFSGGTLKIEIYSDGDQQLVQVMQVAFPATNIPVPLLAMRNKDFVIGHAQAEDQFGLRLAPATVNNEPRLARLILRGDVVRSVQLSGMSSGDARMLAGRLAIPAPAGGGAPEWYQPSPGYTNVTAPNGVVNPPVDFTFYAHDLRDGAFPMGEQFGYWDGSFIPRRSAGMPVPAGSHLLARGDGTNRNARASDPRAMPAAGSELLAAFNGDGRGGDFDNGPGIIEDGAYVAELNFNNVANESAIAAGAPEGGWFQRGGTFKDENGLTFAPWRQASSGFMFGSLPTGMFGTAVNPGPRPWQTLLLCPNPAARRTPASQQPDWIDGSTTRDHFGFKGPRDHLWLEYFWMPPVRPQSLCDGFATEGKVNMNYHMLPFTWLRRDTAMRGVLHGARVTAIPSSAATTAGSDHYKDPQAASELSFRYGVNAGATLEAFEQRQLQDNDVFRSPSEICDQWLVPERLPDHRYESGSIKAALPPAGSNAWQSMLDWWEGDLNTPDDAFEATGDNSRESPYAQIYPRLCTRSNVFTVHWRVQLLRKSRATAPGEWDPASDTVAAEQRGSTVIERYLDPNTTTPPDFATSGASIAVDDYYRWRIVSRKFFTP